MFKRILVAYDGSPGARAALAMAIELYRDGESELSSVSVEEHLPRYAASIGEVEEAKERIDAHFRTLTKEARDRAAMAGIEMEAIVLRGHQVEEIVRCARDGKFDLLVLGSHSHSRIVERIIGSTSHSVARIAACSVLVVRPRESAVDDGPVLDRIVVGVDGSPLGRLALETALDLAVRYGARVIGITVQEASPLARAESLASPYVERIAAAATERARAVDVTFEHVTRVGHAAQALRNEARASGADLLVIGATGIEHPWNPTIGGTAQSVVGEALCSVMLVRPPQAALHVRDVMVRAVTSVAPDTPLGELVQRFVRGDVKALPVVDESRRVVGIITGGDLLNRSDAELRLGIKRELDPETLRERLHALGRTGKTARDVMSRHVDTVSAETDLASVVRFMVSRRVKRLPVVDAARRLVGIISRADILRTLAALPEAHLDATVIARPGLGRSVANATITEVPRVSPDTPADVVLKKLLDTPLRRVVVTESDGTVRGLIGDRDVLTRSGPENRPGLLRRLRGHTTAHPPTGAADFPLTAAALMAPSLITVRPDDSLTHAIRLMMQHHVKRLIVVDEAGKLRGLVDRREVLRLLAGEQ